MIDNILQNGWTMSMIRVVKSQSVDGVYHCIDGMHRTSALQYLIQHHPDRFPNSIFTCHVFENVPEDMQCQLADSNLIYKYVYILIYNQLIIKFK